MVNDVTNLTDLIIKQDKKVKSKKQSLILHLHLFAVFSEEGTLSKLSIHFATSDRIGHTSSLYSELLD